MFPDHPGTCTVMAVQKRVCTDPDRTFADLRDILAKYRDRQPDFVLLPEMFACPYDNAAFPLFAQEDKGDIYQRLSALAREHRIFLIGGSVPERDGHGHIYNTSYIFDRDGALIGKHRKVHLFDIDVKGGQYFKESDVLSPGTKPTVFETEYGMMGVCICFDIRFPSLFAEMRKLDVQMVFVPAAFNMTTGPAHWTTLFRARALDQQIYMLGCSPARDENASYKAYGHSILTDPWGQVADELDAGEGVLIQMIDLARVREVREQIPLG